MNERLNKPLKRPDRITSYWKCEFLVCTIIIISGLGYNFGMLAVPYFEGRLIDGINDSNPMETIGYLLGLFIGVIAVVQILRIIKRYMVRRFANNASYRMRLTIYNNLLHESRQELATTPIGPLLTRAIFDVNSCVEGMRKLTTEIFDTVVLFLSYIIYLMFFSVSMTLYALIPVAIAILVAFLFRKAIFKVTSESRAASSQLSKKTFDQFQNALIYRINGRDTDNLISFDDTLKQYEKKTATAEIMQDTMVPVADVLALSGIIPIVFLGVQLLSNQTALSYAIPTLMTPYWTLGQFMTYLTTFVLMASKASHTAMLFGSVESGLASWKRIKPFIRPYESYAEPEEVPGNDLSVENLSLTLNGKTLFQGLTFHASKNQIVGITGPIASGKSALGKVFLQEVPYQGNVVLFGKNLKDYTPAMISGTITYSGHKNELFTKTIAENIALGEDRATLPYLSAVSFDEDFRSMPDKENTLVGNEGVKLSGGQQERLSLARALYHKKELLILDDPFASVDVKTEKEIVAHLREETKDSIVLLISHRLSSFPTFDWLIVIEENGTLSCGKHEDLLKTSPTYRDLWALQNPQGNL